MPGDGNFNGCRVLGGGPGCPAYPAGGRSHLHRAGSLQESYLNMERILSATITMEADAIHPGFGFLSENSKFAQMCEKCGITFIGPKSDVIARMGK